MAVTIFDRLISLKEWFTRTNTMFNDVGDTTLLDVSLGNNIINGIGVVQTKVGDTSLLAGDISTGDVVGTMNELSDRITRARISEGEPLAYDMHPIHVVGTDTDLDAHGFYE